MRIQLDQEELEEAIQAFITSQGIDLTNIIVDIDLTAGRGANGFTAVVALSKKETETELSMPAESKESLTTEAVVDEDTEIDFDDT